MKELLKLAGNDSPLAGLKPEEVEARDGGLCKCDEPGSAGELCLDLATRAARRVGLRGGRADAVRDDEVFDAFVWRAVLRGPRECRHRRDARVPLPGIIRFRPHSQCETAASQFKGGIIMGLGLALTEETLFDERSGRIMNPSLAEYHVPVHMDVPSIEVIWTDIPDPHSPLGAHGIGEIGITGVGAAVANAVYNATGKRIRELPITLDKIMP